MSKPETCPHCEAGRFTAGLQYGCKSRWVDGVLRRTHTCYKREIKILKRIICLVGPDAPASVHLANVRARAEAGDDSKL